MCCSGHRTISGETNHLPNYCGKRFAYEFESEDKERKQTNKGYKYF